MARSGVGSYGSSPKTIRIECEYRNRRRDGTAICIRDGSDSENPLFPGDKSKRIPNDIWIQVKHIEDSSYSSVYDLTLGDPIEIFIPEWLALEKGMI